MKKIIVLSLAFVLSNKQFAQIEKGVKVPSISLNGYYTDNGNSSTKISIGVYGTYGKFIKENLLLSGSVGYYFDNSKNNLSKVYNNTPSIGVSLLKYKFLSENFAINFGPSFITGYNHNKVITTFGQGNTSTSFSNSIDLELNLQAGIQYFLSKNLAVTGSLGAFGFDYNTNVGSAGSTSNDDSFSIQLNPSFNSFKVGLMYYMSPKTRNFN